MIKKLLDETLTRMLLASGAILGLIVGIISAGTLAVLSVTHAGKTKDEKGKLKITAKK